MNAAETSDPWRGRMAHCPWSSREYVSRAAGTRFGRKAERLYRAGDLDSEPAVRQDWQRESEGDPQACSIEQIGGKSLNQRGVARVDD